MRTCTTSWTTIWMTWYFDISHLERRRENRNDECIVDLVSSIVIMMLIMMCVCVLKPVS